MPKSAIDISYCQQNVDYRAVKLSGVDAVIIRNGYYSKTDTMFSAHMKGAIAAGLNVGTYTYMLSSTPAEAKEEAKQTVQRLEKYKGKLTYPVFADMESDKYFSAARYDTTRRTAILCAFLETIEAEGYYPAVYTNPAWLETYLDKKSIVGKYDIWLAAWTDSPSKPTKFDYGQTMWQWGVGAVNGIKDKVDCDLVYCDYPLRIRNSGKNYLTVKKKVVLAYKAAVRAEPKATGKLLTTLEPGKKCYILEGTETIDPVSGYTYIQVVGNRDQLWIVKSAIK